MRVEVTGRHLEVTPAIEQYVSAKCDKLTRYFNGVQEIDVLVEKVNHAAESFWVEIRVEAVKHDTFVSKCEGDDLHKCVDQCVDKMARQLTDFKSKLKDH